MSVQGCLAEAAGVFAAGDAAATGLQSLLASFSAPALDSGCAADAAAAVAQWSGLLSSASGAPPAELIAAAQRAIGAVLSVLKAVPAPAAKASSGTAAAPSPAELERAVQAAAATAKAAVPPKDAAAARRRLLRLAEQRLAGCAGGGAPPPVPAQHAAGVEALIALAEQRLRVR